MNKDKIFQAIRDVWASPFTERSFRWRQTYLLNPENVFPSILIIPTVNVNKSGVMITTGVVTSSDKDIFISFNRGAGGAVEGQKAESYVLRHDGVDMLISPARESQYTLLPENGGTRKAYSNYNQPVLTKNNLNQLRGLAKEIQNKLVHQDNIGSDGPFDIELGFVDNRIWLFQVRPYIENKKASSSYYLQSMDDKLPKKITISMNQQLSAVQE